MWARLKIKSGSVWMLNVYQSVKVLVPMLALSGGGRIFRRWGPSGRSLGHWVWVPDLILTLLLPGHGMSRVLFHMLFPMATQHAHQEPKSSGSTRSWAGISKTLSQSFSLSLFDNLSIGHFIIVRGNWLKQTTLCFKGQGGRVGTF
jgi:hypothetical protein